MKIDQLKISGYTNPYEILLWQLPENEFESPTRSTIPLLEYWKFPEKVLKKLEDIFKLKNNLSWNIHFEYPVPSAFNTAKSSFTDIMCIANNEAVIGVEGKWFEKAHAPNGYMYIKEWSDSPEREKIIEYWISLINPWSKAEIKRNMVDYVVYQMLHRTASVCHIAKSVKADKAIVLYQKFYLSNEKKSDEYILELNKLVNVIKPTSSLEIVIMSCNLEIIDSDVLKAVISKTSRKNKYRKNYPNFNIRQKLLRGNIFKFGEEKMRYIKER